MCYPKNVQVDFSKLCEVFSFRILFELLFWGETIWRIIFIIFFTAKLLVVVIKASSSLLIEADAEDKYGCHRCQIQKKFKHKKCKYKRSTNTKEIQIKEDRNTNGVITNTNIVIKSSLLD